MSHIVVGACAYLTGSDPATGATFKQLFYQGSPVPSAATVEEIEHNLQVGLIAVVDEFDPGAAALAVGDGGGGQLLEEPARNASTVDWVEFALAKGASEVELDGLKRDDLVEKFGTPVT